MDNTVKKSARFSGYKIIQLSLTAFFAFCVVCPILSMFLRINSASFQKLVNSAQFHSAVVNSLTTSLTATVISLVLALAAAWCLERTAVRLNAFFHMIFVLPMLIPSISHAFGLVTLFGANGLLTNLFGWDQGIYGFWGIVVGSVIYSFPVAFLMFTSILHYEDGLPYKAADILGISKPHQFLAITLPYLRKTMISAFFAVFTMVITDYGVPLMIGGTQITLSVLMYNKAVGMLDYSTGSVIGVFLLLPAVAAFVVDLLNPENSKGAFISEPVKPEERPGRDFTAYLFCVLLGLFVLLPVLAFCVMVFATKYPINMRFTLHHIVKTMERGAGTYFLNSLMYGALTGLIGAAAAFLCAYMTARMQGKFVRGLHFVSMLSMAIPGLVLGLSYVIFFSKTPIYGTVLLIILVNTIHFFSSPYLMMYNTLSKVNENLEAVGLCLGVSRIRIILDVILPKVKYTVLEMFSYFFVNSMMTISAVSFLAPPAPKPVALMINQFEAQLLMESAAFVSLMILLANMCVKGLTTWLGRRSSAG